MFTDGGQVKSSIDHSTFHHTKHISCKIGMHACTNVHSCTQTHAPKITYFAFEMCPIALLVGLLPQS